MKITCSSDTLSGATERHSVRPGAHRPRGMLDITACVVTIDCSGKLVHFCVFSVEHRNNENECGTLNIHIL